MPPETFDDTGFVPLFDGQSLGGWHAQPRVYGAVYPGGPDLNDIIAQHGWVVPANPAAHPAAWHVDGGVLIGQQAEPGYGGYLVSDAEYGDFELVLDARPDWPADTGIMLRRRRDDWAGFQVLLDHRESGGLGGFFGNGLASFSAVPFAIRARRGPDGAVIGIEADDPATSMEPVTQDKIDRLAYAASAEDFLAVWRWDDWNEIRIRCVGALPTITTWVNGLKIAQIDTATIDVDGYDPAAVLDWLGPRGHIALEVHDNDGMFGDARWGAGAQCRWRNIRIKSLD
ncbi:MAG: DUF1080 domain-containing protein [Sphingopyxis sp.]